MAERLRNDVSGNAAFLRERGVGSTQTVGRDDGNPSVFDATITVTAAGTYTWQKGVCTGEHFGTPGATTSTCGNWASTSSAFNVREGYSDVTDNVMSYSSLSSCANPSNSCQLYCLED